MKGLCLECGEYFDIEELEECPVCTYNLCPSCLDYHERHLHSSGL